MKFNALIVRNLIEQINILKPTQKVVEPKNKLSLLFKNYILAVLLQKNQHYEKYFTYRNHII